MLKLKLQYFGHDAKNWLIRKDPDAGKDWRQEEKGTTEDEMVGWYHQHDGHEFEQAPGVGDGQGSLACCSPWGRKESDKLRNWTNLSLGRRVFILQHLPTAINIRGQVLCFGGLSFVLLPLPSLDPLDARSISLLCDAQKWLPTFPNVCPLRHKSHPLLMPTVITFYFSCFASLQALNRACMQISFFYHLSFYSCFFFLMKGCENFHYVSVFSSSHP